MGRDEAVRENSKRRRLPIEAGENRSQTEFFLEVMARVGQNYYTEAWRDGQ